MPRLLAADRMTRPLRRELETAGHEVDGWAMGWNRGLRPGLVERMMERTALLAERHGPVTVIGWSLGGLYAREIAKRLPHAVEQVITLGSPFSGDLRPNRAWRLYARVAGHSIDPPPRPAERRVGQKGVSPVGSRW